jgi:glutamyl-tRNA synthetase
MPPKNLLLKLLKLLNHMNRPMEIKTRFAPSPTGYLTIAYYRTAMFSYIYTKKNNGKFILRIEDTDKDRSRSEFTTDILESLSLKFLVIEQEKYYTA